MKKFILFFIGCVICSTGYAQYNYYRLSAGVGAGATAAFADIETKAFKPMFLGTLDYHITPFISTGLEFQKGTLSSGESPGDIHGRYFTNSFSAFIIGGKVQLGQFVDFENSNFLNAIRGFYIGTGIGVLSNNMTDIARTKTGGDGSIYTFPGLDKSKELFVPVNVGISYNFIDNFRYTKYIVSANYQLNSAFTDNLDGYNDPSVIFKNNGHDFYGVFSIGIKYCFGPEGLY